MKNENNNEKDPEFIRDLFRYRHRRCLETGYYNPHPESFSEQPALYFYIVGAAFYLRIDAS